MRRVRLVGLVLAALAAPAATVAQGEVRTPTAADRAAGPPIMGGQALYLLRCGGCHGIQGVSVPKAIPSLRGRAGAFLCTPAGRDYMLRLPNVQMALIRDDADLAAVMNFVAFDLGGRSAPAGARRFSAAEVAATRGRPLPAGTIAARRNAIIAAAGHCAAAYTKPSPQLPGPY